MDANTGLQGTGTHEDAVLLSYAGRENDRSGVRFHGARELDLNMDWFSPILSFDREEG